MIRKVTTAVGVVVLGAAWAMAPAAAEDLKNKAERAKDKVEDKAERAGEKVESKTERAKDSLERTTEKAKDKLEAAGDKVADKARQAKASIKHTMDTAQTKNVQQALRDKGHDPGPIDGIMGPRTRGALQDFQKAQGLPVSGRLDDQTIAKLEISATPDQRMSDQTTPSASPRTAPQTERRQKP
jgi:peptidoglycan hydrolase-like protein with peptidoglycan-binding domain